MIWVWVKLLKDLLVSLLTWNYGKEVGKHSNLALSTAEHVAKAAVKRMAAPEDTKMTAEDLLPPWVAGESPTKYIKYSEVHANAYETLTVVHPIYFLSQRRCARFRDVDEYEISMRISTIERDLNRHTPDIQNLMDLIMYFKAKFINLVSGYPRIQREIMAFIQKSDIRMKIREDCAQIELVLNYFGNLCQRTSSPNTFSRFQTAFNTGSIFDKMKAIYNCFHITSLEMKNFTLQVDWKRLRSESIVQERELSQRTIQERIKTSNWIKNAYHQLYLKHKKNSTNEPPVKKTRIVSAALFNDVMAQAYGMLLSCTKLDDYPETIFIDRIHIAEIAEKFEKLITIIASTIVCSTVAGPEISEVSNFKIMLREKISDSEEQETPTISSITELCIEHCNHLALQMNVSWNNAKDKEMRTEMKKVNDRESPIRKLVSRKLAEMCSNLLVSPNNVPQKVPKGLSVFKQNVVDLMSEYAPVALNNRAVHHVLYESILYDVRLGCEPTFD